MPQSQAGHLLGARKYLPELDAIRGVAVLAVILHHYVWCDETLLGLPGRGVFKYGWLGVDLFFVLSGFLITGILMDGSDRPGWARRFYLNRLFRIFPLFYLSFALGTVWSFWFDRSSLTTATIVGVGSFCANLSDLMGFSLPDVMSAYWSLAVEEHFYLLWPWAMGRRTRNLRAGLIVGAVCIPIVARVIAFRVDPNTNLYAFTVFRFDAIGWGALVAFLLRQDQLSRRSAIRAATLLFGVSLVGCAVLGAAHSFARTTLPGAALSFTFLDGTIAGVFALIVLASHQVRVRSRWFSMLAFWGDISFFAYLNHGLVRAAFDVLFPRLRVEYDGWLRFAVCLAIVASLGWLSRRWFELPLLAVRDRLNRRLDTAPSSVSLEPGR